MKSKEVIELRPEREYVQIDDIPSSLVRWGVAVISVISAALIAALCLLQYPHSEGETILQHLFNV